MPASLHAAGLRAASTVKAQFEPIPDNPARLRNARQWELYQDCLAAIPIIGAALAPAAAAARGVGIGAFAGKIASASGRYDVPSGVNPVTQLHQNEMVLPAHLADKVRGMPDAGSGGAPQIHIHAMDAKGVEQILRQHQDKLVKVLRGAERDFHFESA